MRIEGAPVFLYGTYLGNNVTNKNLESSISCTPFEIPSRFTREFIFLFFFGILTRILTQTSYGCTSIIWIASGESKTDPLTVMVLDKSIYMLATHREHSSTLGDYNNSGLLKNLQLLNTMIFNQWEVFLFELIRTCG